jgi:hypothetical protein
MMKALIIVDGWEKEMEIPDHCYEQGWVIISGPISVLTRSYKQGCEAMTQDLYEFHCIATGFVKHGLPVFEG